MSSAFSLTGKTRVAAVWGHPVGHSRSPAMQNAALRALGLDWIYVPFDVAPENLAAAVDGIRALGLVGVNCTVPLKENVGRYLDSIDPEAARIGSVNTIVNRDGHLAGHSTDGPGLLWDLERQGLNPDGKNVLIWGAGGSARAVAYALAQRGCNVTIANRTLSRAEDVAQISKGRAVGLDGAAYESALAGADLLINTTTLGLSDPTAMPPLPENLPHPAQFVYDLVYAPTATPLIARATAHGCKSANGLGMLVCQGALSLALWTNRPAQEMPIDAMQAALNL